jgi:hypothetical protein
MLRINKETRLRLGRGLLFAFLVLVTALVPFPSSDAQAASCYGSTCTGLNPETMGCGFGAFTVDDETYSGAYVEKRVSGTPYCNAAWERTKNISGSSKYAAGSARYGCGSFCYSQNVSSPSPISNGSRVYTPMVGPNNTMSIRCCGRVSSYGPISVPVTYNCVGD